MTCLVHGTGHGQGRAGQAAGFEEVQAEKAEGQDARRATSLTEQEDAMKKRNNPTLCICIEVIMVLMIINGHHHRPRPL